MIEPYALIVAGGGPAGLFCAIKVAEKGKKVLVLEKMPDFARKLLISGSGQCNITHDGEIKSFLSHYGDNNQFLKPSLMNFQNSDLAQYFSERNVPLMTEPGGKVFPESRKASDLLGALLLEMNTFGVETRTNEPVVEIKKQNELFQVKTNTSEYLAKTILIATGGYTYPATGSSGDGYHLAKSLGHRITEPGPALTSVSIRDYPFTELSGLSFADLTITLFREGKKIRQHTGDLLFTHTGLSGPGILDFSRFVRSGDTLRISFLPGLDPVKMKETLLERIASAGNRQVKTVLMSFDLPDRFIRTLLDICGVAPDLTAAHLAKKDRVALIEQITACPFVVNKLGGVNEAMVTRGGVDLTEVNSKTMESRIVPGLFFAGEVLDIDGDTGGYNLQAAFSTGFLAAKKIAGQESKNTIISS